MVKEVVRRKDLEREWEGASISGTVPQEDSGAATVSTRSLFLSMSLISVFLIQTFTHTDTHTHTDVYTHTHTYLFNFFSFNILSIFQWEGREKGIFSSHFPFSLSLSNLLTRAVIANEIAALIKAAFSRSWNLFPVRMFTSILLPFSSVCVCV